jgi:hypothetical protein
VAPHLAAEILGFHPKRQAARPNRRGPQRGVDRDVGVRVPREAVAGVLAAALTDQRACAPPDPRVLEPVGPPTPAKEPLGFDVERGDRRLDVQVEVDLDR